MTTSPTSAPATEARRLAPVQDRLVHIDTLRALALFGVIVMNVMAVVMFYKGETVASRAAGADWVFALLDLVLLQGKARSAFAFLFGLGFGVLMQRVEARGQAFAAFYLRRMAVLLALGLLNLTFLFWGDILIVYALLGMTLVLFRGLSDRIVLIAGLALIVAPPLLFGLAEAVTGAPLPNLAGMTQQETWTVFDVLKPAYLGGDFWAYVQANLAYYRIHHLVDTSYIVIYNLGVLGLFLTGVWAARRGVLHDIARWRPLLLRLAWTGLTLGLLLSLIQATRRIGLPAEGVLYGLVTASYVGLPIMAFGYLAALALFIQRRGAWLNRLFAPMGRMALTGYLASNLIASFAWYGWGLGWANGSPMLTLTGINLFAFALFGALCVFSALWLSVFRFGPVEWLWRSLIYGRLQPMLKIRSPRP